MKLTQLIKNLGKYEIYSEINDFKVKGISSHSKKIANNYIFVAIKGTNYDGNAFIDEALKNGAKAVITSSMESAVKYCKGINFIKIIDERKALSDLAAGFYGNPSKGIKVIGITGTNGKTTISYLLEALLQKSGRRCAVIGTINCRFKNKIIDSKNTTPAAEDIQQMLFKILKYGINYCLMEVSSHALDQGRISKVEFNSAIFTNLTQDHLDYHNTMEDYFQAKAKLFKNLDKQAVAIINNDDAYGRMLSGMTAAKIMTYGIYNTADVMAKEIKFGISGSEFVLKYESKEIKLNTPLVGLYNIYNILAAVCFCLKERIDLRVIARALEKFSNVPGRLEKIDTGKDFSVFVDYAHTPEALNNVLGTLRQLCDRRIIVVFGCGGDRDKTKRPKMGQAATELADYAIITNDNSRSESPEDIVNDIKKGISRDNYCVVLDRKQAIEKSLSIASSGDIVLIAGKGHENYQIINNQISEFDDREVVRQCLKSIRY
ncbi:MAG: UDP-N-acetylmuramoyl-L-alanyl-D-glutamate--2,6-diaminopimelate ligase [Candidatus Omnitrophota bacterium]